MSHYFLRDIMLGGLVVLGGVACAILLAVPGARRGIAWRADGTSTAPLAAVYLRSGGAPDELRRGIAADRVVGSITASNLAEATSAARMIGRIPNSFWSQPRHLLRSA